MLALGVALGVGATGTFAFWTDDVAISGTSFTAGTLDLQVNNADAYATTTLSMTTMVPADTSAEVLTMKNAGNVPLRYTLVGNLTGTDAALFSSENALNLTVRLGGTRSVATANPTCTGGTQIYTGALKNTANTVILPKRPTTSVAPNGTEALCFQVTFATNAADTLQGKTATATFTAKATSDLS